MENRSQPIFSAFKLGRRNIFEENYGVSIITENYKLIDKNNEAKLFDLEKDEGETVNLKEAYPSITAQLQEQVEQWKESVRQSIRKVGCIL